MSSTPTAGLVRVNRGRSHTYRLDGRQVDGVTTILGAGLPKPALVPWVARVCAEYVVDHFDDLTAMTPSERLNVIRGAPNRDRDTAARRGTEVHRLAADLAAGHEVEVPDELAGHVDAYLRFVDDWQPTEVLVETPVAHRAHQWAGTLDLVADLADGHRWLLDLKTTRSGVFPDTALQLAAYRNAETCLVDDHEEPMPAVDATGVVWLRADGYDLVPVDTTGHAYRMFRHCQQVAHWARRLSTGVVGEALTRPATGQEPAA
jgi:hypothetical protein